MWQQQQFVCCSARDVHYFVCRSITALRDVQLSSAHSKQELLSAKRREASNCRVHVSIHHHRVRFDMCTAELPEKRNGFLTAIGHETPLRANSLDLPSNVETKDSRVAEFTRSDVRVILFVSAVHFLYTRNSLV